MKKYKVKFEYYDKYCKKGKWNVQAGTFEAEDEYHAVKKCKEFYGLGVDCEYRIVRVDEVE